MDGVSAPAALHEQIVLREAACTGVPFDDVVGDQPVPTLGAVGTFVQRILARRLCYVLALDEW